MQWYCPRKPRTSGVNSTNARRKPHRHRPDGFPRRPSHDRPRQNQWPMEHLDAVNRLPFPPTSPRPSPKPPAPASTSTPSAPAPENLLYRIHLTKRPETRAIKIAAAVECLCQSSTRMRFAPLRDYFSCFPPSGDCGNSSIRPIASQFIPCRPKMPMISSPFPASCCWCLLDGGRSSPSCIGL